MRMRQTQKKVWIVRYDGKGKDENVLEVIADNYTTLSQWINRYMWVATITEIKLDRVINELIPPKKGNTAC